MEEEKQEQKRERKKLDFTLLADSRLAALDLTLSQMSRFSVSKEQIKNALESKDATALRQYSQYFFFNSGEYRRLVEYFGAILTCDHLVIPYNTGNVTETAFIKSFDKILTYTEKSHVKDTCSEIALIIVRDGAFFGYERESDDTIAMQQLPTAYCRTRFKINGVYAVEFDFSYFDQFRKEDKEEMLGAFDDVFLDGYIKYLGDRINERWQMLDPQFARCHMLTDNIPILSPVFLDLIELEDYKTIDKTKSKLDIYKIIAQKIPVDKEGEITLEMPEITALHNNLRKMVKNSAVDVITTPCDLEAVDLQDKSQTLKDDIGKATNVIYSTAGTPMILFNSGAKTGSVGLDLSVKVDEAILFKLLNQYERWYNNKFENISKSPKTEFKMMFPPITIFNRKEMLDLYKEGSSLGYPTKLLTMTILGITQKQFEGLLYYENDILKLHEKMIPTQSAFNPIADEGGRPESDNPLSEEGEKTRDQDKNKNRAKGGG